MKRTGVILCLSLIVVMLAGTFAFAAGFELESSYPEEGSHNSMVQNVAIKLVFSENITSEEAQKANEECFSMEDSEGNAVSITPAYDAEKYPNEVWIMVLEAKLASDMDYKLTIAPEMQSSNGDILGEPVTVNFRTRNIEKDSSVSMILMVVMMVGLIGFGAFETKRQIKKEMEKKGQVEKVNPYKEAKKTGKSVEDVVAKTEKQKARVAKKYNAQQAKKKEDGEPEEEESLPEGIKRVHGPKSVKAAGGKLPASVVGRSAARAKAAQALAEAEARAQAKGVQGGGKGSKQQQRKKKR